MGASPADSGPADPRAEAPTIITDGARTPPSDELLGVGDLLDGRYRIAELRGGRGVSGMGVVYIVDDEAAGGRYAVKSFQRVYARKLLIVQRFVREARTWMLTGFHPNIVQAFHLDIIDALPYLFMEYVENDARQRHSVADYLNRGALSTNVALDFAVQVCDAFEHALAAVPDLVHRDLKPENILVTPDGVAKVTDFGLVRCRVAGELLVKHGMDPEDATEASDHLTRVGAVFGTPPYMAPEQFEDPASVTVAADIYALGCVLYEMLTGQPPFVVAERTTVERVEAFRRRHTSSGPISLRERMRDCPRELDRIVMRCLEKQPDARWESFAALRAALARVVERALGMGPRQPPALEPSAQQVGLQMRSITLLDGYEQAVRMRNLRERHEVSPYSFHLALASFFHVQGDRAEERRQLEKAARARRGEHGDEVARRLGALYVETGQLDAAHLVFEDYLAEHPGNLERILEPYVALLLERGDFERAQTLVDGLGESTRAHPLRAGVLRARGDAAGLADYLAAHAEATLDDVAARIRRLQPDDTIGLQHAADLDVLRSLLLQFRADCPRDVLDVVDVAAWPDLSGYPDFAQDLAWLSNDFGELVRLRPDASAAPAWREAAALLGYPNRLPAHTSREERWFWQQEVSHDRA